MIKKGFFYLLVVCFIQADMLYGMAGSAIRRSAPTSLQQLYGATRGKATATKQALKDTIKRIRENIQELNRQILDTNQLAERIRLAEEALLKAPGLAKEQLFAQPQEMVKGLSKHLYQEAQRAAQSELLKAGLKTDRLKEQIGQKARAVGRTVQSELDRLSKTDLKKLILKNEAQRPSLSELGLNPYAVGGALGASGLVGAGLYGAFPRLKAKESASLAMSPEESEALKEIAQLQELLLEAQIARNEGNDQAALEEQKIVYDLLQNKYILVEDAQRLFNRLVDQALAPDKLRPSDLDRAIKMNALYYLTLLLDPADETQQQDALAFKFLINDQSLLEKINPINLYAKLLRLAQRAQSPLAEYAQQKLNEKDFFAAQEAQVGPQLDESSESEKEID